MSARLGRSFFVGCLALVLVLGVGLATAAPMVEGNNIIVDRRDGGTAGTPAEAALAYDVVRQRLMFGDGGTWTALANTSDVVLLASPFIGAVTVASTNYGGDVLPARPFTVSQVTMRTSVVGSGGSTCFEFRITDGTNTCSCTMACNAAIGNKSLTCAALADGGTGCAFAASASLIYMVNSIGDCTVGPTVVGNAQIRGTWQ